VKAASRLVGTAFWPSRFISANTKGPSMRILGLSLSGLACVAALIVVAPNLAKSQPGVLPLALGQASADGVEQVGYRYRRYRYARPYYRPYYRPYAYYRPYYRPYAYYYSPYPYYYRPGFSFWFGF